MNLIDFQFSDGPGNQTVVLYQGREIATARSLPEACSFVLDTILLGHLPQGRSESKVQAHPIVEAIALHRVLSSNARNIAWQGQIRVRRQLIDFLSEREVVPATEVRRSTPIDAPYELTSSDTVRRATGWRRGHHNQSIALSSTTFPIPTLV